MSDWRLNEVRRQTQTGVHDGGGEKNNVSRRFLESGKITTHIFVFLGENESMMAMDELHLFDGLIQRACVPRASANAHSDGGCK